MRAVFQCKDIEKDSKETNIKQAVERKKEVLAVKRLLDVVLSLFGLILLSPVFLLTGAVIKLDSQGPVFFRQERVGRNACIFNIYKFRTMVRYAEEIGIQLTVGQDARITRVGGFLRKYKLDELPQLFNVLKGDMSLVGPRPEVPRYFNLYGGLERLVTLVRPGITDYASIRFINESEFLSQGDDPEDLYVGKVLPEKIRLKLAYIRNISILTDIKILLCTVAEIFRK